MRQLIVAVILGSLFASPAPAEEKKEKGGFSQEQRERMKAAFKAARESAKPLRRELRDALAALRDKLEDEAGDKALEAALARVEKARQALRAQREKARAELASKLTVEQRARWALKSAKREGRGRGFRGWRGRD